MTFDETMALLYLGKRLFPRDKSMGKDAQEMAEIGEVWTEMLRDIPFDLAKAALTAHAANSPYAPAISEIRACAKRMTEPEPLTADEAWSLAIKAIRRFGHGTCRDRNGKFPSDRARESVPPEVWRVMDRMGYTSMCLSDNVDLLRGQFIRAWERQQQRKAERESILPFLPEGLREKVLGLTSGQEGQ